MMSKLFTIFALLAAVGAEAPYYSNRPSPQAPAFNYPAPVPQYQQPAPQAPAPVYHPPTPAYHSPAPAYQAPVPAYHAPAPAYHAPVPSYNAPALAPVYHTPAPAPIPAYNPPAPAYHTQLPPANQYVQYPPIVNSPQPQPQPQQQQQSGYNYERPSIAPAFLQQQPVINQTPQFVQVQNPAPVFNAPRPQPAPIQLPNSQSSQSGYSYHQPQQAFSRGSQQLQAYQQQPLPAQNAQPYFQSQPKNNYDQAQYNSVSQSQSQQAAPSTSSVNQLQHSTILDSHTVNHVSSILAQNEENQARNLGYYQRVSGVSLEGVSPSLELSAHVQNVPLSSASEAAQSQTHSASSLQDLSSSSGPLTISAGAQSSSLDNLSPSVSSAPIRELSSYGLPTVVDNRSAQSTASSGQTSNYNFVPTPNQQPNFSYGLPN